LTFRHRKVNVLPVDTSRGGAVQVKVTLEITGEEEEVAAWVASRLGDSNVAQSDWSEGRAKDYVSDCNGLQKTVLGVLLVHSDEGPHLGTRAISKGDLKKALERYAPEDYRTTRAGSFGPFMSGFGRKELEPPFTLYRNRYLIEDRVAGAIRDALLADPGDVSPDLLALLETAEISG
jgi:hypothetical protein